MHHERAIAIGRTVTSSALLAAVRLGGLLRLGQAVAEGGATSGRSAGVVLWGGRRAFGAGKKVGLVGGKAGELDATVGGEV